MHYGPLLNLSSGLHQWAVTVGPGGHLVVENFAARHDLTELLRGTARVAARREGDWVVAVVEREAEEDAEEDFDW